MRHHTPLTPMTVLAWAPSEMVGTADRWCQGPSHGTLKANTAETLFCRLPFSGSTQNKDHETKDKDLVATLTCPRSPHRSDCTCGAGVRDTAHTVTLWGTPKVTVSI